MTKKESSLKNVNKSKHGNTIFRFGDLSEEKIFGIIHSIWSENEKETPSYKGWLKDDTSEVRFSLMFDPKVVPNKGDLVEIKSYVIGEHGNDIKVLVYKQTDVDILSDSEDRYPDRNPYDRKPDMDDISDLDVGSRNVHLIGRVTNVTKNYPWGKLKKQATLKDGSGEINLKIWFHSDISNGDFIHIKGSCVKEYLGEPEIELRKGDFIERLSDYEIEDEDGLDWITSESNNEYQNMKNFPKEVVSEWISKATMESCQIMNKLKVY